MMEHTPGPWHLVNGNEIHDKPCTFDESGARIGETPNLIATVEYVSFGQSEANAHLIAAAPDLLKILKGIDKHGYVNFDDFEIVKATIAKAEGGAQ